MPREQFPFASERSLELREQPVSVVSVMERAGLENLQTIDGDKLAPEQAIDIDNRALRETKAPNVFFGRPHGGEYVPRELLDSMSDDALSGTLVYIDRGTHNIFRSEYIPSVGTKISRFIVDTNRHPLPGEKLRSSRVPGEVLWKKGMSGENLYLPGKEPSAEKVRELTEQFYLLYYNSLLGVTGALLDRREKETERILMVDGHSFTSTGPLAVIIEKYMKEHYDSAMTSDQFPMFILGDIDGSGCDEDIRKKFREILEAKFAALDQEMQKKLLAGIGGGLVLENFQFKGVHNVDFWSGYDGTEAVGKNVHKVNALQIECNESAYSHSDGTYDFERLAVVRKLIEETSLEISDYLKFS
jgi:N-formylglutamate amidohydrolase